jgi:hypothetical protein
MDYVHLSCLDKNPVITLAVGRGRRCSPGPAPRRPPGLAAAAERINTPHAIAGHGEQMPSAASSNAAAALDNVCVCCRARGRTMVVTTGMVQAVACPLLP